MENVEAICNLFEDQMLDQYGFNMNQDRYMTEFPGVLQGFENQTQKSIRANFQFQLEMLKLDAIDQQLLREFINLKPDKTLVRYFLIPFITFHISIHWPLF